MKSLLTGLGALLRSSLPQGILERHCRVKPCYVRRTCRSMESFSMESFSTQSFRSLIPAPLALICAHRATPLAAERP